MKAKKIIFPLILIFLIILISSLFHFKIHIEDAITLEPLSEYGIAISVWRIIFEPIIGLLLFFNRVLYSIDELLFTLVWVFLVFIIYSVLRSIFIKENKKKFIIAQVVNTPLLLGLWFIVFVVIVFIPLPNNTIVNNSANSVLVTTHSHTNYSHDGLISQKGLWKWHKRNGFDAFFITDHNNHNETLEFVQAQRNIVFPIEPLVMCGEEFSGTNHLSLLGLKRKFNTSGYADSTVIDSVRANNGVVIVNHWFDGKHKSLDYYNDIGVDGFEIENSATERIYDRNIFKEIKEYCESKNLILNGGLDFHGYGNVCSIWNAFIIPNWHSFDPASKEEAILSIIRNRDQSKLKVLIYKDRAYYGSHNLFFSPLFTLFNYFRTLNLYQLIFWIIWISIFTFLKIRIHDVLIFKENVTAYKLLPIVSLLSSLFLIVLGLSYYMKIESIIGFTEMYEEYSAILLYVGAAFFIYSGLTIYFRNKAE